MNYRYQTKPYLSFKRFDYKYCEFVYIKRTLNKVLTLEIQTRKAKMFSFLKPRKWLETQSAVSKKNKSKNYNEAVSNPFFLSIVRVT